MYTACRASWGILRKLGSVIGTADGDMLLSDDLEGLMMTAFLVYESESFAVEGFDRSPNLAVGP
jgi:hypothetical protein